MAPSTIIPLTSECPTKTWVFSIEQYQLRIMFAITKVRSIFDVYIFGHLLGLTESDILLIAYLKVAAISLLVKLIEVIFHQL
ncbi:hypothetical protein [Peribacillus sp. NJ4]|nr:hypothetical protein [Peribacillus sp. NJ4]